MALLPRVIRVMILAAFFMRLMTLPMLGTNDSLPFNALLLNCKVIYKPRDIGWIQPVSAALLCCEIYLLPASGAGGSPCNLASAWRLHKLKHLLNQTNRTSV